MVTSLRDEDNEVHALLPRSEPDTTRDTLLYVGPESMQGLLQEAWPGHLCRTDTPQATLSLAARARLWVVHLESVPDPLTLIAHVWCEHPELPVLCITREQRGESFASLEENALRMGVWAVLPADEGDLLRVWLRWAYSQPAQHALTFSRELSQMLGKVQGWISDMPDTSQLQPVLSEIARFFRAERASLLLFDPEEHPAREEALALPSPPRATAAASQGSVLRMVAHCGFSPEVPDTIRIRPGEGVAGRVVQEGKPHLILRSLELHKKFSDLAPNLEILASMAVPISAHGAQGQRVMLGVLNLARGEGKEVFAPRDLELCSFLAASLGEWLTRMQHFEARHALQQRLAAVEKLSYAGEMAAGIAHEVANPISYVHANLKVLQDYWHELTPLLQRIRAEAAPQMRDAIDDIPTLLEETLGGTERATRIIHDMKAMVRPQDRNEPPVWVSLTGLVNDALRMLRPRLAGRCRVETDLAPDVYIRGHAVELSQVVVNLVANAADAIEERHRGELLPAGTLEVRVQRVAQGPVLEVIDDGVGIDPQVMPRIFAPLFTTKAQRGTGLGLGIVRRIVDAHGATIEVASEPGRGTHVTLRFPAERREPGQG